MLTRRLSKIFLATAHLRYSNLCHGDYHYLFAYVAALWQPLSWRPMSVNIYSRWSTGMSTFAKETNVMDTKKENIYNNIVHADKSTRGWSLRDHINVTFVGRFSATVIFHVGGVGWVIRLPCSTRVNLIDPLSAGPANIPRWRAWRRFFYGPIRRLCGFEVNVNVVEDCRCNTANNGKLSENQWLIGSQFSSNGS